ncbi:MAG: hypothetical protein ACK5UE_12580 [Chitinophagales bacterium]|jgi:Fe-S cluster assembly ATPase SufC|nr:hypothetical protein [Sphingobacteriales bacterium]
MEVLLEEKKKQVHKLIDANQDEEFIDRVLAMLEIQSIKVNRDPSQGISGEEARKRTIEKINSWWGK